MDMELPKNIGIVEEVQDDKSGVVLMAMFNNLPVRAGFSWGIDSPSMVGEGAENHKKNFLRKLEIPGPPNVVLKSVRYNSERTLVVTQDNLEQLRARANGHGIQTHADVFVTDVTGLSLMVTPADCTVSVLFGRTKAGKGVLGMAHAGWRETIELVPETVIQEMINLGCEPRDLLVSVAPSIAQDNFWVKRTDMSENERKKWGTRARNDMTEKDGKVVKLNVLARVIDIMIQQGVSPSNVLAYAVDTFEASIRSVSFSHRASVVKSNPILDGRFAVAAAIVD